MSDKIDIVISEFPQPVCDLFGPDGVLIGQLTSEYQVNDVLIQIKRQCLQGYYIMFEGIKLEIAKEGRIYKQPEGFYDTITNQLIEILGF